MAFHDFHSENYFGTKFEGNETNKLLKHINELREILPEKYHIFVGILKLCKRVLLWFFCRTKLQREQNLKKIG